MTLLARKTEEEEKKRRRQEEEETTTAPRAAGRDGVIGETSHEKLLRTLSDVKQLSIYVQIMLASYQVRP